MLSYVRKHTWTLAEIEVGHSLHVSNFHKIGNCIHGF